MKELEALNRGIDSEIQRLKEIGPLSLSDFINPSPEMTALVTARDFYRKVLEEFAVKIYRVVSGCDFTPQNVPEAIKQHKFKASFIPMAVPAGQQFDVHLLQICRALADNFWRENSCIWFGRIYYCKKPTFAGQVEYIIYFCD
jgi:hypothetical protein